MSMLSLVVFAEVKLNPDKNTLWSEDGKNIELSDRVGGNSWYSPKMPFESLENGSSFVMGGEGNLKTIRYLPLSANYPWFEFEITASHHYGGYKAWCMNFHKGPSIGQVTNPQTGRYVYNLFETGATAKSGSDYISIYIYNLKLNFCCLRVVKQPDYYITVESEAFAKQQFGPGDTVKFTIYMKDQAEDVTIRFIDSYGVKEMRLNKQDKLQLKPIDDTGKVWSATVKIEELGSQETYKATQIMLKAVILGGKIDQPIWTAIQYPYHNHKEKK